jgi:hypothetical protein
MRKYEIRRAAAGDWYIYRASFMFQGPTFTRIKSFYDCLQYLYLVEGANA